MDTEKEQQNGGSDMLG